MSERTFVPIFVFWAFLTIITPTLVLLSENSKQDFDLYGNYSTKVADARRMMDGRENPVKKTTLPPCATAIETEELIPPPAQAPTGANLTACHHKNGSIGSNRSDDGVIVQVFPRKHLKQTTKVSIHNG